jgi:hypothetical protein
MRRILSPGRSGSIISMGMIGHGVSGERIPLDGVTVGEESSDADGYLTLRVSDLVSKDELSRADIAFSPTS